MSRRAVSAILCLTLALLVGCGSAKFKKNRLKTTTASGTVIYRGQPLTDAIIVCFPNVAGEKAVAASAYSDSNGSFNLSAYPPDKGAVAGDYRVTVQKTAPAEPAPQPEPGRAAHDVLPGPPPRPLIPAKYSNVDTSGLTLKIPESGTSDIKFELVD